MEFEVKVHTDKTFVVRFVKPDLRVEAEVTDDDLEVMINVIRAGQAERIIWNSGGTC